MIINHLHTENNKLGVKRKSKGQQHKCHTIGSIFIDFMNRRLPFIGFAVLQRVPQLPCASCCLCPASVGVAVDCCNTHPATIVSWNNYFLCDIGCYFVRTS